MATHLRITSQSWFHTNSSSLTKTTFTRAVYCITAKSTAYNQHNRLLLLQNLGMHLIELSGGKTQLIFTKRNQSQFEKDQCLSQLVTGQKPFPYCQQTISARSSIVITQPGFTLSNIVLTYNNITVN